MVMWDLCIDPASYHNRRLDLARWRRLLRSAVSQLSRLVSLRRHDLLGVCILFAAFISVDTAKSWRTLHVDIARGHVCSGYAAEIDRADRGRLRPGHQPRRSRLVDWGYPHGVGPRRLVHDAVRNGPCAGPGTSKPGAALKQVELGRGSFFGGLPAISRVGRHRRARLTSKTSQQEDCRYRIFHRGRLAHPEPRSGERVPNREAARRVRGKSAHHLQAEGFALRVCCPSPGPRCARATRSPRGEGFAAPPSGTSKRDRRAHEIALAELDPAMAQDVVGGGAVEIEVWQ
jgi:hypothetical protein